MYETDADADSDLSWESGSECDHYGDQLVIRRWFCLSSIGGFGHKTNMQHVICWSIKSAAYKHQHVLAIYVTFATCCQPRLVGQPQLNESESLGSLSDGRGRQFWRSTKMRKLATAGAHFQVASGNFFVVLPCQR